MQGRAGVTGIAYRSCEVVGLQCTGKFVRIELESQIRLAAEQVCGSQNLRRAGSIRQVVKNRNCYQKAVAGALDSIKATAR